MSGIPTSYISVIDINGEMMMKESPFLEPGIKCCGGAVLKVASLQLKLAAMFVAIDAIDGDRVGGQVPNKPVGNAAISDGVVLHEIDVRAAHNALASFLCRPAVNKG